MYRYSSNTLFRQNWAWSLRRNLQLSPMQSLMRQLSRRSIPLGQLDALEMFGGDGSRHTMDYYRRVRTLDVWEIDADLSSRLRRNLPGARIKTTDSFHEIQVAESTYDLIVIDTPASLFGPGKQYCEHFEIFTPSLFRIARTRAIIIVNVVPDLVHSVTARRRPASSQQLSKRGCFYKTDRPELIAIDKMVDVYRQIANLAGFELQWHCSLSRTLRSRVHYLALLMDRL